MLKIIFDDHRISDVELALKFRNKPITNKLQKDKYNMGS